MSKNDHEKKQALGPNAWLIDEMYRRFNEAPDSVSDSWKDFFADYHPSLPVANVPPASPQAQPTKQDQKEPDGTNLGEIPKGAKPLRGPAARIVENMESSLEIPTATSTRIIPVKILDENRRIINDHQVGLGGAKVSFTHIIAWALMKSIQKHPAMAASFFSKDGQAHKIIPETINFGLAVDVERRDGSRSLLVPNIKNAHQLDFLGFFSSYNDVLRKVRTNQIDVSDFANTTITLTNPGTIGTVHSIPRLMKGQGLIIASGGIQYPPEWQAADASTVARLGISKVMMVTSTYDHRVIQGAESGLFLQSFDKFMQGDGDFYEEIYANLKIPYMVASATTDVNPVFSSGTSAEVEKQAKVLQLINIYRVRGHLIANLNPLKTESKTHPELEPERYGLTMWDFDREFITGGLGGHPRLSLRQILNILRDAYCRTLALEYMHIQEPAQKEWLQQWMEGIPRTSWFDISTKKRILKNLNDADAFERFLHTKYVGHKRFGLEGAESLIPVINTIFEEASNSGTEEVMLGMAHRGRLNVLANNFQKSYKRIFKEFDGDLDPESEQGSGDVKYHVGATAEFTSMEGNKISITLSSNPSHLEACDPVVEGMARARQDMLGDKDGRRVLPVLIHGDSAFAGQGVVAETLNLSALSGYTTGGTIHIVVNNGIGFTTAEADARSTVYATDVAKMVQAPIFHVNGDDPEACVRAVLIATAFRQKFKKDVVVDIICYRRHGHNEGDEPSYTQPIMYKTIKEKRSVRKLYTETLVRRGDITLEDAEEILNTFHKTLESAFDSTRESAPRPVPRPTGFKPEQLDPVVDTSVPKETLIEILNALTTTPDSFTIHPKLQRQIAMRKKMFDADRIDWALGEALGFGSLVVENTPVRLSGQDSRRGTFSQRHSVLVDYKTEKYHVPLNNIRKEQALYSVYDSLLSEYAVMGFEYGYAVTRPEALTLWEGQFGDFVNGAQIIIDQFIASSEDKWQQTNRLVLLLPHGFEGQGPEHSSGRLERFLTLCAEYNMRVAIPSNSAQYFHLLRRQMHVKDPKPLIVMTPKSLLRSESARSPVKDFTNGTFQLLIDDHDPPAKPTKLLFCSGKLYYDLLAFREKTKNKDTAIVRMEQLYPFPYGPLREIIKKYSTALDIRWVQEEPRNMGAWYFILARMWNVIPETCSFTYVSRFSSASPATGSARVHAVEQEHLVKKAFSGIENLTTQGARRFLEQKAEYPD